MQQVLLTFTTIPLTVFWGTYRWGQLQHKGLPDTMFCNMCTRSSVCPQFLGDGSSRKL